MIRNCFFLSLLILSFSSCQRDITIKLDPTTTDLVIDASIENGKYPMVTLSKSLNYFSKLDPVLLTSSYVHNAYVTISNGSISGQLKEDSIKNDSTGLQIYYYTFNNSY